MRIRLELPVDVVEFDEGGETFAAREPRFFGAHARWGCIEDRGETILLDADIEAEELAFIPPEYRR